MITGKIRITMKVQGFNLFELDERKGTFKLNEGKLTVNVKSDGKSNEVDIDFKAVAVAIVSKSKTPSLNEVKLQSRTLGWTTLYLILLTQRAADECRDILLQYKKNAKIQAVEDNSNQHSESFLTGNDPNPLSIEGQ